MKRLFPIVAGVAVLALVASFPHAQEGSARPENSGDDQKAGGSDAKPASGRGKSRILHARIVPLKHVQAEMARHLLVKEFPDEFTEESRTDVNEEHNSLLFTAPLEMFPQILEVLRDFDEPAAVAKEVAGAERTPWREVYRAIGACLPHDRTMEERLEEDPTLKHRIRILSITMAKFDDLGEWYSKFTFHEKRFMRSDDRASGPSGSGYVFTFQGRHSHDEPKNPRMCGIPYVETTLLRNLKHWTVREFDVNRLQPAGELIPVRQIGITHPTITSAQPTKMVVYQPARETDVEDRPASRVPPGAGENRKIPIYDFTIQFAWQDVPSAQRKAVDPHEKEVAAELAAKDDFLPNLAAASSATEGTTKDPEAVQREPGVAGDGEIKIFRIKNADATESRQLLLELYPSEFKDRSKIAADVRTNTLVVRGRRELLEVIEAVLLSLDDFETASKPQGKRVADRQSATDDTTGGPPTGAATARENWLSALQMAADPDSEVQRVREDFRRLDQKATEQARQYRQTQGAGAAKGLSSLEDPASMKLKAELEETVQAAFDARQKVQSYETDRLRQRLAQIESRLTMRERAEKEIVRQRVEELLHPERDWEPAGETNSSPPAWGKGPDNRAQKQSPAATEDSAASMRGPRDSARRTSGEASSLERTRDSAALSSPDVIGNPRKDVLDAESAATAARAAVAAAEKACDFSRSDLKRTHDVHQKGAVSDKALRTAERQVTDDDARLEKAKLDLQHAERQAKLARENLESRIRILKLDMADVNLRVAHLADEEARARRLFESKAMSNAEYDGTKLALEQARLQLSRITEHMELYAKPIPGVEHSDAADGKKESPDPRSKKDDGGSALRR